MQYVTTALLILLPAILCSAQEDRRLKKIEPQLEELLETWDAPGFAVAVVEKDKVIYSKGFGLRNRENNLPVTPNTLFAIGSCSKAFTSAILGQLKQETDLSLDDRPAEYIDGFHFYNENMDNQITIRDIMCHRTGLPRHDYSWYFFPTDNRDSLMMRVAYQKPTFGVRERWQYNNFMFLAQGVIAERLTGKSWENNIQERFFVPLNMNRSTLDIPEMVEDADHATGYQTLENGTIRPMDYYHIGAMAPAGSINSSVMEMANWVRLWINGGKWEDEQIIPENYLSEAISSQMVVRGALPDPEVPDLHMGNYGYGWFLSSYRGHYRVEHGGNIDGFSANTSFFPSDSIGIIVLTNQNGSTIPSLVRNMVADRMLDLDPVDWSKRMKKQRDEMVAAQKKNISSLYSNRKENTTPSHPREEYIGKFSNPAAGMATILWRNDSLFMKSSKYDIWLRHYHYDVFEPFFINQYGVDTTASMIRVIFQTNAAGEVSGFTINLEQGLDPILFERAIIEVDVTESDLQPYVGEYELEGITARFYTKKDGKLYLTVPNQPEYTLVPTGRHNFAIKDLDGFTIEFTHENGEISEAVFKQPNGVFTAKRKK